MTSYTWRCSHCGGRGTVVAAPGQDVPALIVEAHGKLPVVCVFDAEAVKMGRVAA